MLDNIGCESFIVTSIEAVYLIDDAPSWPCAHSFGHIAIFVLMLMI